MPIEPPVTVPASPVPDTTITLIRYILVTIGGVFVSKGWISDADLSSIIGAALIIIPTLYGVIRSHRNHKIQKKMANALPDCVARVE